MCDGTVAGGVVGMDWVDGLEVWYCIKPDSRSVFFRVRDDGSACGWCFADAAGGDAFKPKLPRHRYDLRGGLA